MVTFLNLPIITFIPSHYLVNCQLLLFITIGLGFYRH